MADVPVIKNIYQRMVEVQKEVLTVFKNETIQVSGERSYKGVTHDDVAKLLHLPLAKAGIVLLPNVTEYATTEFEVEKKGYQGGTYKQKWYRTDMKISVKWINADKPDDFIESIGGSFALDTSDKGFAKAYSLALKIILLKVHLLESRDGEEQRTFEQEEPAPTKRQDKPKTNAVAQGASAPTATAKKPPSNMAPVTTEVEEQILNFAIDRQVSEGELFHLVIEGYGVQRSKKPPMWVALEILELLKKPETNSATVMAESIKVKNRREAAAIAKANPSAST